MTQINITHTERQPFVTAAYVQHFGLHLFPFLYHIARVQKSTFGQFRYMNQPF